MLKQTSIHDIYKPALTNQRCARVCYKAKKVNLYSTLLCPVTKALTYGQHVTRGPHSFTCHPQMHLTCLYSPAARCHRPLAGTQCAYPRRDSQAELTWVAGYIPK